MDVSRLVQDNTRPSVNIPNLMEDEEELNSEELQSEFITKEIQEESSSESESEIEKPLSKEDKLKSFMDGELLKFQKQPNGAPEVKVEKKKQKRERESEEKSSKKQKKRKDDNDKSKSIPVKRPRTAYVFFSNESRNQMVTDASMSPQDVMKLIASKWQSLPKDQRLKFEALADEDKRRYQEELAEYHKKMGTTPKSAPTKSKTDSIPSTPPPITVTLGPSTMQYHHHNQSPSSTPHPSPSHETASHQHYNLPAPTHTSSYYNAQFQQQQLQQQLQLQQQQSFKMIRVKRKDDEYYRTISIPIKCTIDELKDKIKTKLKITTTSTTAITATSTIIPDESINTISNGLSNNNEMEKRRYWEITSIISPNRKVIVEDSEDVSLLPDDSELEITISELSNQSDT